MKRSLARLLRTSAACFALCTASSGGWSTAQEAEKPDPGSASAPSGEAKEDAERASPSAEWTASDTRLANHYIRLLQSEPAYGNVLDLLWDLYEAKEQTPLLLDYFRGAAESGKAPVPRLILAHLLRKSGDTDGARAGYDEVLTAEPGNVHAMRALAEIADQQQRHSKALSLYLRLAERIPPDSEEGAAVWMRKAALLRRQGQNGEAVAAWDAILRAHPGDVRLRTEIVAMLLEAGETGKAVAILEEQAASPDPRRKLDALEELNRLHEFVSDFEAAARSAREGMSLLHFKDHRHGEFFTRLVRNHERFQRLPELEEELRRAAYRDHPTERDLHLLAEFYRLTADARAEEKALARLVEVLPRDVDYRIRLAETQMRNDRYEEAAATLDALMEEEGTFPLDLVLLRAKVALADERREEAGLILGDHLSRTGADEDTVKRVIDFARAHYLDKLVENLLRQRQAEGLAGSDGESAPLELARFLRDRGRTAAAIETLENYIDSSGEAVTERARRLHHASVAFRELDLDDEALRAIDEAVELNPDNPDFLDARIEILVDRKEVEEAVTAMEKVRAMQESLADKAAVDQRIFSLLRGHYAVDQAAPEPASSGPINSVADYRRQAAAASRMRHPVDDAPPPEVLAYYRTVRERAGSAPSAESRYRAAWWAFKLQDNSECYSQLTTAQEEAEKAGGEPIVEVEKMLLDLAEANERPINMARHLATLMEIDPENADEYRRRRAEVRFELGFEDEAVRELRALAAAPDATLGTLRALADVYRRQGSTGKQVEVWRRAYRSANVFEKRRVIKQLTSALEESGRPEEALEAQVDLMVRENDAVQRRKQLDSQLTLARTHFLLGWLRDRYTELAQRSPFDRFFPEALARIHRANGDDREAFEAMKKAYYMSGHNEELLGELGELADDLGDLESAIYYRRQVLASEGSNATAESWRSLVGMLEKDLRVGEADRLRRRLESKFGQDPDFLRELAAHYRGSDRPGDAERVLERLVALREWDVPARMELALLKKANGRPGEALPLFESVIERTARTEAPASAGQLWPLLRATGADGKGSGAHRRSGFYNKRKARNLSTGTTAAPRELEDLAILVEDYPGLDGELQERVAQWLQRPHPEFQSLPRKDYFLRLRAIEEAGALHAAAGRSGEWMARWDGSAGDEDGNGEKAQAGSGAGTERLWAARHGGGPAALRRALLEIPPPGDSAGRFCRIFLWTLAGGRDPVGLPPASGFGAAQDGEDSLVAVSAFAILRNFDGDPLRRPGALAGLLAGTPVSASEGFHLFSGLRKVGRVEEAWLVGEALADSRLEDSGNFLFDVSQAADWTGRPGEHRRFLDRAIPLLRESAGSSYHVALTEKLALLDSAARREEFLAEESRTISERFRPGTVNALEKQLQLSLASQHYDRAVDFLAALVDHQVDAMRPASGDNDRERVLYRQNQRWSDLEKLLLSCEARLPLTAERAVRFAAALEGRSVAPPVDRAVRQQFESYEMRRQLPLLEHLNAPERRRAVERIRSGLRDEASLMELARYLEQRGYFRETIPLYREAAFANGQDFSPLRELFAASDEALDPTVALDLIDRLQAREMAVPPGLDSDYLAEQHARFLFHRRDLERLSQLGQAPMARPGAPPITSSAHLPYQRALIRAYRHAGEDEALLRLLAHLRNTGEISGGQLLLGAELLRRRDQDGTALEWLEEIPLDGDRYSVQHWHRAVSERMALREELGEPDRGELIEFARHGLEHAAPTLFGVEVAGALDRAGHGDDAVGVLRLYHREAGEPAFRAEAALQLLATRLGHGVAWPELRGELEMCFQVLGQREAAFPDLAELLLAHPAPELGDLLADLDAPPGASWMRDLLRAALAGTLAETAGRFFDGLETDDGADRNRGARVAREDRDQFLEALAALGPEGTAAAARLAGSTTLPGDRFFPGDPARQIDFFTAIGDRRRLEEVHARLMREAGSDYFTRQGLVNSVPTFYNRQRIPGRFAERGCPDLAGALFRRYESVLRHQLTREHRDFLEEYAEFLIEQEDYAGAEKLLGRVAQKSLRVDMRLFARLYHEWGKADQWQQRAAPFHLAPGLVALMEEWTDALAEGRGMVEYSPSWE